jgi:hypothetical protein
MRSGDPNAGGGRAPRRRRIVSAGLVVLVAMLTLATTASAGTLVGETTTISMSTGEPTQESTLVKGTAFYDSSGQAILSLTTAVESPEAELSAGLFNVGEGECSVFGVIGGGIPAPGSVAMKTKSLKDPVNAAVLLSSGIEQPLTAQKSVAQATTTFSVSSPLLANQTYDCALLSSTIQREGGGQVGGATFMSFKVAPPPAPPATSSVSGGGPALTAPPAPPAALKITKPKTTTVKVGKWATAKVTVSNKGGTALTSGSLRVKPVKGVNVKPESQKLPTLAPGASWTMTVKVQLTEKAKAKSTLGLTASGKGATTGTGSLVVKLKE